MADGQYILWATPHSLYAGKARSYLIKKDVSFREVSAADPEFLGKVIPQVGHMVIPVVRIPSGAIVQDTTAIIDTIEASSPAPDFTPRGLVQQVVAHLLDAFGSNYLLPLAMHYRWSYRDQQELFLRTEFARAIPPMPYAQRLETAGKLMTRFAGFLTNLGVTEAVIPALEESYAELLAVLDRHFQRHPYLLGGRPSLADFGMMAPLYAHLARDPVPGLLMKTTAPNVFRWTERMNIAAIEDPDFPGYAPVFPADDALPDTLEDILKVLFAQWEPGLAADAACFDQWVGSLADPAPGQLVSHNGARQVHPHVGRISYAWRDVTMERASQPHSLWHFARAQAAAAALTGKDAARLADLLDRTGGAAMMAIATSRPIRRENNVLVLG